MQINFSIHYNTQWGESLSLVLSDVKYPMSWAGDGKWTVSVKNVKASDLTDYTYVVIRDGLIVRPEWEHHSAELKSKIEDKWLECPVSGCPFPRKHSCELFDKPHWRGAGTAIPIFALRSEDDFGIGDFRDLHNLVDWVSATGQSIIQLLPINDTTRKGGWEDSYPYSPISSFALHPLYLRLQDVGISENAEFRSKQKILNDLPQIDYPLVFKEKMALIRQAFESKGRSEVKKREFKEFCKTNAYWLDEYAQFCAQRDSLEADYYKWMQWHLEKQLSEEVAYAHSKGVYLKGDLPIGVSADSADAHFHPELFNLDSSAGAPPDFFSADGQNWGFPTYNWDAMAADCFAWWKSRLRKMAIYFDAFRIDHILGFFRIWEIPVEVKSGMFGHFNPALPYSLEDIQARGLQVEGLFHEDPRHKGMYQPLISPDWNKIAPAQRGVFEYLYNDFFYHRHDAFWQRGASIKLPELLGATGMLACGEDLGMIPDCVNRVMDHEKILSLEMQQMDKGRNWPELSVCATSSHDMPTLRMQYAQSHGGQDMEPWQVRRVLSDHLTSASMLAIFPLQDWVALDRQTRRGVYKNERINDPANPHNHWCYRFHRDIADLKTASELNAEISGLLMDSGRYLLH